MPAKSKTAEPAGMVSEDAIRQRAYFMWEADGRPDGRHEHYWHLAQSEVAKAGAAPNGNGAAKPTATAKARVAKAVKLDEPKPAKKATKPRAAVAVAKK